MYHYPPFAKIYRQRMLALGYSWGTRMGTEWITVNYQRLTWQRLLPLARENRLSCIIRICNVSYSSVPVFAN